MAIYDERLWQYLESKAADEDGKLPGNKKCSAGYLAAIREICDYAVSLSATIRDVFPMYTLHDEMHICAVLQKMEQLLGDNLELLSRDEAAMLILAACCHDLGMSCSEDQRLDLQNDPDRLERYFDDHPDAYVRMREQADRTVLPDDLLREVLRSIHHERVKEILNARPWPAVLQGKVRRTDLVSVCQSHGKNAERIIDLQQTAGVDLRMCAILLRLADILDFDSSRAPQAVYDYTGFNSQQEDRSAAFSKDKWDEHTSSHGFSFDYVEDRSYPYELPYSATCPNMQIEQAIASYLDWVDQELAACQGMLWCCKDKWRGLILPRRIKREIEPCGYVSGQFRFSLDQDKVLDLLVGNNLYQDTGVFVRELLQNAIDAVRTRQRMDRHLPSNWKPQINIRSWMDEEGYHWFRIEDNGTGMNRDIIEKYFLKVGKSYYASDDFQRDKYRNETDKGYQPISRFGIGILSCFMGDKKTNRVEVSTLHFSDNSDALRMSMHGLTGYYYLANRKDCPNAVPMKGFLPEEQRPYRSRPGTAIAVRTNLYQKGQYHTFREILDQYVAYPVVPIRYEDENGKFYDYPTEQELMDVMHAIAPSDDPEKRGVLEFVPTQEQIRKIENIFPGLKILEPPRVVLKCECLDQCSSSEFLSGAVLLTKVVGGKASCKVKVGTEILDPEVRFEEVCDKDILRLGTKLVFPGEFTMRMRLYESQRYEAQEKLHRAIEAAPDDMTRAILEGILHQYDTDEKWYEWLCRYWGGSRRDAQNRVEEVRKKYKSLLTTLNEQDELEAYERYSRAFDTALCDLNDLQWYTHFWKEALPRNKHISLAAHNGVRCGDAGFCVDAKYSDSIKEAVLLMKDYYRPELDVARTRILQLPLAAAIEIELLRREWERQGFSVSKADLAEAEYWKIPNHVYHKLMSEQPALVKRLRIQTDHGVIPVESIPEALRQFAELKLQNLPELISSREYTKNRHLYQYFSLAYLRKHYGMVIRVKSRYDRDLLLLPEPPVDRCQGWEKFPPTFFLPVEGGAAWIAKGYEYSRYFCNESHPLSQFLIRNRAKLEESVPGLFWEIMRSLAGDSGEEMIPKVNECLQRINALPGDMPKAPKNAFLKESDFL